ncbi:MAG: methylase [Treponema sp.]|nr:methylase [Treponema sp.]
MTQTEQSKAAKKFSEDWKDKGYEKGESQKFWLDLLCNVFGIKDFANFVYFENQIKEKFTDKTITNFIDIYIPSTKVMIEQKSIDKDLREPIRQSDGTLLNPFQQARKYISGLPLSQHPRWVVTSNFKSFLVYDMEQPNGEPEEILLENLEKDIWRLQFLTDAKNEHIKKELEISKKAGDIIGEIYDAILKQYKDADNPSPATLKSLNMLCVRIVFCLYAEDAGIFGHKAIFGDYLKQFEAKDLRRALLDLFQVLDQKEEERDEYLEESLAAFPYVNGGLFTEEDKTIPPLTEDIKELLVKHASSEFDWSEISPTIFGAIFESTLNPQTRRSGGMHYTSIENIHKVIDPLFLDDLKAEFEELKQIKNTANRIEKVKEFHKRLGTLKFLDPACGSGNFLTETYLSLRKLGNECIKVELNIGEGELALAYKAEDLIQVSIQQFYGIEINDFAAVVAKTALWIAESQMMKETAKIIEKELKFLPLHTYANIIEGNALRIDWGSVVPKNELNYILGNPPFVGYSLQSESQKKDILETFVDEKGKTYKTAGKIDYVAGWYYKAAKMMQGTQIKAALVSTNSITQGEQVAAIWKPLFNQFEIHFNFAYRTFRWDSEANIKAHVHCVILGFSSCESKNDKIIYLNESQKTVAKNINGYLIDGDNVWIENRAKPLCNVPEMVTGNRPADGGHLIIEADDYDGFIKKEPNAIKYIKKLLGAEEFLNNKKRYCLWLVGANPSEIRKMPEIMKRVEACKQDRLNGAPDRQKLADTPTLFRETFNPESFIVVPVVSSENRRYIPFAFLTSEYICTDRIKFLPDAKLYHFGVLNSNVHMAWMRAVCGRLKSDYNYSKDIVYNNFPWCNPTEEQKTKIEETAQAILDARAKYPDSSLADLYDETLMPPELRKAHQANDRAVMAAYGFSTKMTESECVAELFKMYEKLTEKIQ